MKKVKISKATFEVSKLTGRHVQRGEDYGLFGGINPDSNIFWTDEEGERHEVFSYGFDGESYYVEIEDDWNGGYSIIEVEKNDYLEIEE